MPSGTRTAGKSTKAQRLLDDDGAQANAGPAAGAGSSSSSVAAVQQQVEAVRVTMQDNVNVLVENIEKGSNLEARSADLANQAQAFSRTARRTSRHMWWVNCKSKIFLYGGCGLILLIIVLVILGQMGVFNGGGGDSSPPAIHSLPPSPSPALSPPPPEKSE